MKLKTFISIIFFILFPIAPLFLFSGSNTEIMDYVIGMIFAFCFAYLIASLLSGD